MFNQINWLYNNDFDVNCKVNNGYIALEISFIITKNWKKKKKFNIIQ